MVLLKHLYFSIYFSLVLIKTCYLNEIKFGVLLPTDSNFPWSVQRAMPAIDIAVERVVTNIIPGYRVTTVVNDTECSDTIAPLAATNLYMDQQVHVFFGPVCDYALAPVARYSTHWNIPVITTGAFNSAFDDKMEYKLLTRVLGTNSDAANAFIDITKWFNWTHFGLLYQDNRHHGSGKSECFFKAEALYKKFRDSYHDHSTWHRKFDDGVSDQHLDDMLRSASLYARIIVLCGSADTVRKLMIKAHEIDLDNGDFVFINYDILTKKCSSTRENGIPWYRENDTVERNGKARKAYEALVTISLRQTYSSEYKSFSHEVRRRANQRYQNITFGVDEVNIFVGAFHDAVVLYGLALNKTLEANGSPMNGTEVTARMRDITFQGITGVVSIDSNGDRLADYSLMDMDPVTGKFEVVLNYFGRSKEVAFVPGKHIHWPGGYIKAPPDTPKCGFDDSKCPTVAISETTTSKENTVYCPQASSSSRVSQTVDTIRLLKSICSFFLVVFYLLFYKATY